MINFPFYTCFLFLLLLPTFSQGQEIPKQPLYDINGVEYTPQKMKEGSVFFLISSLTCGYCLNEIPFYNHLSETYSDKIKFIVLLENKNGYVEKYKEDKTLFYNDDWIIIPNSLKVIRKIWKEKVFPEYHFFVDGQLIKSFAFSNKNTREEVLNFLKGIDN